MENTTSYITPRQFGGGDSGRGRPRDFSESQKSDMTLWIAIPIAFMVLFISIGCLCIYCPFCIWATRRRNNRQIGYGGQAVIGVGVPQQPTYGQWLQQGGAYQAPGGYDGQQPVPAYGQQQAPGYESAPSGSGPQVEQAPHTA